MPYAALPDHKMPYDNDGTVLGYTGNFTESYAANAARGVTAWMTQANMAELNDDDYTGLPGGNLLLVSEGDVRTFWLFFPESREVTGHYYGINDTNTAFTASTGLVLFMGSADTGNGVDGTWETASMPSGFGQSWITLDGWRATIKPVSFTGPKRVIRLTQAAATGSSANGHACNCLHIYGEKAAGQTPDDIIFINHDDTPGVEFAASEDFGDQPLGTTVVRQFRLKNTSATKTANSINIQCNDTDFAISENGSTWVATINITSLSAGSESSTLYVRCVTPAIGGLLGPRLNRIVVTVGSYT